MESRLIRFQPHTLLMLVFLVTSAVASAEISVERRMEIIHLLKHDCGSCHGMRLQGGLGPALTPERFRQWETRQLALTILYGRPGTPMPPWRPFLTDVEALWLATQLKRGITP